LSGNRLRKKIGKHSCDGKRYAGPPEERWGGKPKAPARRAVRRRDVRKVCIFNVAFTVLGEGAKELLQFGGSGAGEQPAVMLTEANKHGT